MQNSAFWNISYLGLCCNWVALNINLKSDWVFWNTKISEDIGLRVWTELEINICFVRKSWAKSYAQIQKIKQNRLFYVMFSGWYFATFRLKSSQFSCWLACWVLAIGPSHFRDFLGHKLFGNWWENWYINSLSSDNNPVPFNLWRRQVFSWFLDLCVNLEIVKEKPTRKTCFSREKKRLAPRIYQAKFYLAAFLWSQRNLYYIFTRNRCWNGESIFEKV